MDNRCLTVTYYFHQLLPSPALIPWPTKESEENHHTISVGVYYLQFLGKGFMLPIGIDSITSKPFHNRFIGHFPLIATIYYSH